MWAIFLISIPLLAAQPTEWEYGPDGWREADAPAARTEDPVRAADAGAMADLLPAVEDEPFDFDDAFDPVIARLDRGDGKGAFKRAVDWLVTHDGDPRYDQGLYLAAQGLYVYGNRIKSFFYADQLLDQHPQSPLWDDSLSLQYRIADAYLDGYKDRVLGIPAARNTGDAIEMLFRIIERAPGSPLAERALLRTGDFFYADGQFDLAADVYQNYNERYPRSPRSRQVRLREALANLRQFEGPRFDVTPLLDARSRLGELQAADPQFAADRGVSELLAGIERQLGAKLLATAEFYERTGEDRAAVQTYQRLLARYPEIPAADRARDRVAALDVPEAADAQ